VYALYLLFLLSDSGNIIYSASLHVA